MLRLWLTLLALMSVRCAPKLSIISPPSDDWNKGHELPDLLEGGLFGDVVFVRVANRGTRFVKDVRLEVLEGTHVQASATPASASIGLAPSQRSSVFAPLALSGPPGALKVPADSCPLAVQVRITVNGTAASNTLTLRLRCRKYEDSITFAFVDVDGSAQVAAAKLPKQGSNCKAPFLCPVLLSMHGMDVTSQRQADSYRFPAKNMWILAPHGRGTHALFWQGIAHRSAEAALVELNRLSALRAPAIVSSLDNLLITGHSNGGFGALMLGIKYPDLALAIAPLAGMARLGRNLQANGKFPVDPSLVAVLEASISEYRIELTPENAKGIPFLARTGSQDEVIAPESTRQIGRMMCGHMFIDGCSAIEVPGKGHWWWDTDSENDGGAGRCGKRKC